MTHFLWKKVALKLLLVSFWARMTSIFHACQFFINSEHILVILRPKNWNWLFTQFQLLFHRQADFWTLQRPPESDSWGFHGGIPSSGTQGSPPNHFRKKIISGLKSLTPSPSPLCTVHIPLDERPTVTCVSSDLTDCEWNSFYLNTGWILTTKKGLCNRRVWL